MDEEEILNRNYKGGKTRLTETIKFLDISIKRMQDISKVMTYNTDSKVIYSIVTKLQKSKDQVNYMLSRFNKLDTEIVVPWKKI